jgi:hypothetical protein
MPDIELDCTCGNPECRQSLFVRKGAVFYKDENGNETHHWNQGYVNVFGVTPSPQVMLDPEKMIELRDWLCEMYPLTPDDEES